MPFDSTFPVDNSLISSAELRTQFNGLVSLTQDNDNLVLDQLAAQISTTAANVNGITEVAVGVSDPPTQFEVQAIVDKLNELIVGLRRT